MPDDVAIDQQREILKQDRLARQSQIDEIMEDLKKALDRPAEPSIEQRLSRLEETVAQVVADIQVLKKNRSRHQ